jgi:acetoin utilization deacetylase AcuC-like enzyme
MKIVYAKEYERRYPTNPVESPERVAAPARMLRGCPFVLPRSASFEEIARIHSIGHIEDVRRRGLYETAALAAGGAVCAAELAVSGQPSFALIRPPGHHASADHAWGMCFFNNIGVATAGLIGWGIKVLIIDIDLHFGDGTVSLFRWSEGVRILNPGSVDWGFEYLSMDSSGYLSQIESAMNGGGYDIVAVSAGFDTYLEDWGGLLSLDDFRRIGEAIRIGSEKRCSGRRFAVLEGGYHKDLGDCIMSFLKGFS